MVTQSESLFCPTGNHQPKNFKTMRNHSHMKICQSKNPKCYSLHHVGHPFQGGLHHLRSREDIFVQKPAPGVFVFMALHLNYHHTGWHLGQVSKQKQHVDKPEENVEQQYFSEIQDCVTFENVSRSLGQRRRKQPLKEELGFSPQNCSSGQILRFDKLP